MNYYKVLIFVFLWGVGHASDVQCDGVQEKKQTHQSNTSSLGVEMISHKEEPVILKQLITAVMEDEASWDDSGEKAFELAQLYEMHEKYKKAEEWYLFSAKKGFVNAQYHLGWMYESGNEKALHDANKAMYWYQEAAKKGDSDAYNNLGAMYLNDDRVSNDTAKAIEMFNMREHWEMIWHLII